MAKFNKLKGYKYALKHVKKNHYDTKIGLHEDSDSPYVCDLLVTYLQILNIWDTTKKELREFFPEFLALDPIEYKGLGWWPLTQAGKNERIKALERIIKDLENGK